MYTNSKLQKIIWDNSIIGFAQVDAEGRFISVNPALCGLLEYTETELLDRTYQEITHPEDVQDDAEMAKKVFYGEIDTYVMTKRYITKTEKVIWVKLKVVRVSKEDNTFDFFFSQISPAVVMDPIKSIVPVKIKSNWFAEFVKNEWKWLLTVLVASTVFLAKEYAKQEVTNNRLNTIEESITEIKAAIEKLPKR